MPTDSGVADPDADDSPVRPPWAETPDEANADRGRPHRPAARDSRGAGGTDFPRSVPRPTHSPRLDARAAAADPAIHAGLAARLSDREAAGWLAHAHAWVHPLDLALHAAGLTPSPAQAAFGRPAASLPETLRDWRDPGAWTDPPLTPLAADAERLATAVASPGRCASSPAAARLPPQRPRRCWRRSGPAQWIWPGS